MMNVAPFTSPLLAASCDVCNRRAEASATDPREAEELARREGFETRLFRIWVLTICSACLQKKLADLPVRRESLP
jgi:hypothetical protein